MNGTTTDLAEFAARQQAHFDRTISASERKLQGHFGTSPSIAKFMAEMFSENRSDSIRILDPGAGVGILSAILCQTICHNRANRKIYVELWENDKKLIPLLKSTMDRCQSALGELGHQLTFDVCAEDFILANTQTSLFSDGPQPSFHMAITNPPYFKLRKDSQHARVMSHVVHGQPNIYTLFMALATDFLLPNGEMVAITPRSYFNGPYFKRFRIWFFDRAVPRKIHVFETRNDAFRKDSVLQENVIMLVEKGGKPKVIELSSSSGTDFKSIKTQTSPFEQIIDSISGDKIVRVASDPFETLILEAMDSFPQRFRQLGYEVSTGPVVTFRSTEFLRDSKSSDTVPLLWMHNVRPFITQFPKANGKPTHIQVTEKSKKLLISAKTYVLLKRFTAKEESKRLVAGIFRAGDSYGDLVGIENHVNYVYRKGAILHLSEAFGLAAFFNSSFVDRYFRSISGNTQVNATELRELPIPTVQRIQDIGEQVQRLGSFEPRAIEMIVGKCLGLPKQLLERLLEDANG